MFSSFQSERSNHPKHTDAEGRNPINVYLSYPLSLHEQSSRTHAPTIYRAWYDTLSQKQFRPLPLKKLCNAKNVDLYSHLYILIQDLGYTFVKIRVLMTGSNCKSTIRFQEVWRRSGFVDTYILYIYTYVYTSTVMEKTTRYSNPLVLEGQHCVCSVRDIL